MLESLQSVLQWITFLGLAVSLWFYLTSYVGARRVLKAVARPRPASADDAALPGVTILKPLKGLEADLFENLSTFCRQDYPKFQVVFGVADASDPAVQIVQRLREQYPNVATDLVIDPRVYGTNYKISNLENMHATSLHDVLVIADSDIRVRSDYLRHIVAALSDPKVGVATCLYRAVSSGDFPSFVESLFVNTDFVPMVMVASVVENPTYAFGATMALRRSVLDEIGGFRALTNFLADDYYLGQRVAQRGYRLALVDMIVETVLAVGSWPGLVDHQLRWARTYRNVRPRGYFASILTHGVLWSILHLFLNGFSTGAWAIALGLAGVRVLTASVISNHYLHAPLSFAQALLVPVKDLFVSSIWFTAFLGDTVQWSGTEFRVHPDGEMAHVSAPAAAAGPAAYKPPVAEEPDPQRASL